MQKIIPEPKFNLIGHRGVAGLRPENTLASIRYAAQLGLNWIEIDARLTKDQHWVLMHDSRVDRTTNGIGEVHELTLAEIQKLDAGSWYHPQFRNEKVPTLDNVLDLAYEIGININVEIKGSEQNPKSHAKLLAEFLKFKIPENFAQPLISSFDLDFLIYLRQESDNIPIGYLIEEFNQDTFPIALYHSFTTINCNITNISGKYLSTAKRHNMPVLLYTVNDPIKAQFWLKNGATAIFTDRPDLLM